MFTDHIRRAIVRDLGTVAAELEAYQDEADIWRLVPGVNNSAGTLALHLAGNIQHYIGAMLGGSGYARDRTAEFNRRDVPRAEMLEDIHAAIRAVNVTLPEVMEGQLEAPVPEAIMTVPPGKGALSGGQFLVHLTTHLSFHLGQIDYHRRVLTGGGPAPGALSIPALLDGD